MATNKKTAAVVSGTVDPGALATMGPDDLAALIANARAALATVDKPEPRERIILTAADSGALASVGWRSPYVGHSVAFAPAEGSTPNSERRSLLAPFYNVTAGILLKGSVSLSDVARLLAATIGERENARSVASILQTLANRMGRRIAWEGITVRLCGTTGIAPTAPVTAAV
jgi:hypothetical protein